MPTRRRIPADDRARPRPEPRHRVLQACALTAALALAIPTYAQETQDIPIVWHLEEADAAAVEDGLDYDGEVRAVEGEDVRGAPLLLLVGVAVLPSLVDTLIGYYRDVDEGGVVIDATGTELVIRNDTALPYGTILVRDQDGVELQNFRSTPKPPDLSAAIAEAVKGVAARP